MEKKGIEIWVGLFVLAAIVVICGMILQFGKFRERFQQMYSFQVRFQNVGQIARGAPVITAGVTVGKVEAITLEKKGSVLLKLGVWQGIIIRDDAKFTIKQAGLLGDLHVVATPVSDTAPPLKDGDIVKGINPTDIQDTLEQAAAIVVKMKSAADNVESATQKLDKQILNDETLSNLRQAISNVNVATARADGLIQDVRVLVTNTSVGIQSTMANMNQFSTNLTQASSKVLDIVNTNQGDIRTAVQNIKESTEHLDTILADVQSGKGTIGKLLVDETFHQELKRLITNLRRFGVLGYKDVPLLKEEPKPGKPPGQPTLVPSETAPKGKTRTKPGGL